MNKKVKQELIFIPHDVRAINHVEHIYNCRNCEQNDISATTVTPKHPPALIVDSIISPSPVANTINDKYVKSLPLYRQKLSYQRLGININRQNMSNWLIRVSDTYFKPMIGQMYQQLLKMKYISADETGL